MASVDISKPGAIRRVMIENVYPEIDGGRFPVKRINGEHVSVFADIFADGHDVISGVLMHKKANAPEWVETPLKPIVNDRYRASFQISETAGHVYTLCAWIDEFRTWRKSLIKKLSARQDVSVDLQIGAAIIRKTAENAPEPDSRWLLDQAAVLVSDLPYKQKVFNAMDDGLYHMMQKHPDRNAATFYGRELEITVEREKALYSTWYEMFPRSCGPDDHTHGTFADCEKRLPYIAEMGFDVLYLPPIHPIGRTHRKGKNNSTAAAPDDPGSPWAIGSAEGGHTDIHPQLGTLEDFKKFRDSAKACGIELALDMAFQCAPDHPYVHKHPEWFRHRPDGTIQYAENPPKKYEDIFPLDFETRDRTALWEALRDVVFFWVQQGIRIFRVDNPHTKPFAFWEWLIHSVKTRHPDTIFLAEAFARPKTMYRLAKLGFSQSYTYFTWRNTAHDIQKYFRELTQTQVREFFRPNLWPNTPDILPEYLQTGGRPGFIVRLVLAATLSASYGIYGPAFELCDHQPRKWGTEEYLDSEKYQIKNWHIGSPENLADLIARVNRIRRENPALQNNQSLKFYPVDNEEVICYSKRSPDGANIILVVVNLDPHHTHGAWVDLPQAKLKLDAEKSYQMHDLLSDARYLWSGSRNFVELNPRIMPAHVFAIRRKLKTEQDFDYYL